jgi:hypothetical protein
VVRGLPSVSWGFSLCIILFLELFALQASLLDPWSEWDGMRETVAEGQQHQQQARASLQLQQEGGAAQESQISVAGANGVGAARL